MLQSMDVETERNIIQCGMFASKSRRYGDVNLGCDALMRASSENARGICHDIPFRDLVLARIPGNYRGDSPMYDCCGQSYR